MSDNNGVVITPVNVQYVGGSGSGGTLIVSGGSGPVTGAAAFYVNNGLDVQGFLSNSLGGPVIVSGGMQVLGNLIFNSSSLTGSGGASFTNSGSYLLTSSFNTYTGSVAAQIAAISGGNTFTGSGSYLLTASFNTYTGSLSSQFANIASATASLQSQVTSLQSATASLQTFTASIGPQVSALQTFTGSVSTQIAALQSATASLQLFTGSANTQFSALQSFTGSVNGQLSAIQSFDASVSATTSSLLAFSASVNAFTASLTSTYDARYVTTASFTNTQVTSMVTGNLDTRYAAFGSSGSGGGGGSVTPFTASYDFASFVIDDDAMGNLQSFALGYIAGGTQWYSAGAGTTALYTTTIYPQHPGVYAIGTGTGASGYAYLYATYNTLCGGACQMEYEVIAMLPTLSTSTQRYQSILGLGNSVNGTAPTTGIYITYSDNINSGGWQFVSTAGGTATTLSSGITAAAGTWVRLGFVLNAAGNSITCYANGSSVGTITTNIPNGSSQTFGIIQANASSVGTTTKLLLIDRIYFSMHGLTRS